MTALFGAIGARHGVMVGDSTRDARAAQAAGIAAIGILTGGFSEQELVESGCREVYRCVHDLLEHLDETALR